MLEDYIIRGAIGLGAILTAGAITSHYLEYRANKTIDTFYQNILCKSADVNKDRTISISEKTKYLRKALQGKGVYIIEGEELPRYKNGEKVPITEFAKWLTNYKP